MSEGVTTLETFARRPSLGLVRRIASLTQVTACVVNVHTSNEGSSRSTEECGSGLSSKAGERTGSSGYAVQSHDGHQ